MAVWSFQRDAFSLIYYHQIRYRILNVTNWLLKTKTRKIAFIVCNNVREGFVCDFLTSARLLVALLHTMYDLKPWFEYKILMWWAWDSDKCQLLQPLCIFPSWTSFGLRRADDGSGPSHCSNLIEYYFWEQLF